MANNGTAAQTMVAANCLVIINNQVVGLCTSASWDLDFNVRPIYGIDNLVPQELIPTTYKCNFNLSGLRIQQKSLEAAGITTYPGANTFAPYISIAILERLSQQAMLNINAAMIDSCKNTVSAKGLVTFELSGIGFVGLSSAGSGYPGYSGTPQQII